MDAVNSTPDSLKKSRLFRLRALIVILVLGAVAYFVSSLVRQRLLTAVLSEEVKDRGGYFSNEAGGYAGTDFLTAFRALEFDNRLRYWTFDVVSWPRRPAVTLMSLSNPGFDDAWLEHHKTALKRVPRLHLRLSGSSITDEGLKHLGPLPNLEEILIGDCQATTATGLSILCGSRTIAQAIFWSKKPTEKLVLRITSPQPEPENPDCLLLVNRLRSIVDLSQLEHVQLPAEELSLAAIEQLNKAPGLKTVEITHAVDRDILLLSRLKPVHLKIDCFFLTNASVPILKTLKSAKSVELDLAKRVSEEDLNEIKDAGVNVSRTPMYTCGWAASFAEAEPKDVESTSDESVESAME